MTQHQVLEQIRRFPIAARIQLLEEISRELREDFNNVELNGAKQRTSIKDKVELTQEQRRAAIERLRGIAATDDPPLTKEETREEYYNYIAEKYR